jgi:3-hydroxyacyl-CoA dehydrogenase
MLEAYLMFKTISVIGSGVMGSGIAQSFAVGGYSVIVNDIKQEFLDKARKNIDENLELLVGSGDLTAENRNASADRLRFTTDLQSTAAESDLIIEAIPEVIEMKWNLYNELAKYKKADAIVSSNTSTFPITKLTAHESFGDKFIITHFFNPAQLVPLVEIVKKKDADPELIQSVKNLLLSIGKSPVVLKKEINGFIANRLQTALMREAFSLVGQGVADADDVDKAITAGPGFRWAFVGPTRIADFGGLDTWKRVFDNIAPDLDKSEGAPELINQLVKTHKLGTKTGEGLYKYSGDDVRSQLKKRDNYFLELGRIKRVNE